MKNFEKTRAAYRKHKRDHPSTPDEYDYCAREDVYFPIVERDPDTNTKMPVFLLSKPPRGARPAKHPRMRVYTLTPSGESVARYSAYRAVVRLETTSTKITLRVIGRDELGAFRALMFFAHTGNPQTLTALHISHAEHHHLVGLEDENLEALNTKGAAQ